QIHASVGQIAAQPRQCSRRIWQSQVQLHRRRHEVLPVQPFRHPNCFEPAHTTAEMRPGNPSGRYNLGMSRSRADLKATTGAILLPIIVLLAGAAYPLREPTFYKDVLPILQNRCQTCHRPREAAPMALLTYDETRPWAKAIREAIVSRRMPPWFADPAYG